MGWLKLILLLALIPITGCGKVFNDSNSSATTPPRAVVDPPIEEPLESSPPRLLSLNDINFDGLQDFVVINEDSESGQLTAVVKDTNDDLISNIDFGDNCRFLSALTLPDMNGDTVEELAVSCQDRTSGEIKTEIREPFNGGLIGNLSYNSDVLWLLSTLIDDMNGDGYPELAALGREPAPSEALVAQIRDPLNDTFISDVFFNNALLPRDLLSIPDINFSGFPELVLLAETSDGEFTSIIRDAQSGELLSSKTLGDQSSALQLAKAPASIALEEPEEIAVLSNGDSPQVLIYEAPDGTQSSLVSLIPAFDPVKLLIISDLNDNQSLELAVLSTNPQTGTTTSEVRDARTGELITNIPLPRLNNPLDMVAIPDTNANGSPELVYLGRRDGDGSLEVLIHDSKTRARLGRLNFGSP